MIITLEAGGITLTLDKGIFWVDEFSTPRAIEDVFYDVNDGSEVVQRLVNTCGKDVTLEAKGNETSGRSFWTRAQIRQIELWEISGELITFTYGDKILILRTLANPFNVTPLRDVGGHTDSDIYFGTVKFKEVM